MFNVYRVTALLFLVEVVPRSEEDVRISIALEAPDRLEALRRGLIEIGLEGREAGAASVEPREGGALQVTAVDGSFAFVVRPAASPVDSGALDGPVPDSPVSDVPVPDAPAPPSAGTSVASESDDALLDESRLEQYFADENEPGADEGEPAAAEPVVPVVAEASRPRAPLASTTSEADASASDEARAARVLAGLADLEENVYDIAAAMDLAARVLLRPLAADVACVLLIDRRGKALGFAGLAGDAPSRLAKFRYPKGLGLPWLACDERRALLVNGIDRDEGLHQEVLEKTGFRIRSTILAPIQSEGRTWGVLQAVRSAVDAPDFGPADLAVIEAAALRIGAYLTLFGTYL